MSAVLQIASTLGQVGRLLDRLGERVLAWDEAALAWVSEHPFFRRIDGLLVLSTYLGDGYIWGLLALYLILFGTPYDHRNVLISLAVLMVEITVFRLFKALFARPRPALAEHAQTSRMLALDIHSFPSGHATIAFGIAYLIAFFYPAWPNVLLSYLVAGLIALSRVYLKEHYPMDVIGGAILGTLVSYVLAPLFCALIH